MNFVSLIDIKTKNIVTIDANSFVLRVEFNKNAREIRIKPYFSKILYQIFSRHPTPVNYEDVMSIFKEYGITMTDTTRIHRKISELKKMMNSIFPNFGEILMNTRGIGYSLSLDFKNLDQISGKNRSISFKNPKISESIGMVELLVDDAINLTQKCNIIRMDSAYIMDTTKIKQDISDKVEIFDEAEKTIAEEIKVHFADFFAIKLRYLMAKLRTYIGLSRISEYSISKDQWLDWFKSEIFQAFEDVKTVIKSTEN